MTTATPILVGVDGSAGSYNAVRWAAVDAALRHSPLWLVAIYAKPFDVFRSASSAEIYIGEQEVAGGRLLRDATDIAHSESERLGEVTVQTALLGGRPAPLLLDLAQDARMLVVGSRGLGELTGGIVGSVSSAVAAHAPCPVVVVKGLPEPGKPVLDGPVIVGVDGTPTSEPAIAAAMEEASLRQADVTAVHAWTDVDLSSTTFGDRETCLPVNWSAVEAQEHVALAERMAGWKEQFPEVGIRRVVVQDKPVRELAAISNDAQLLVVGSRGRGGFKGMLLGSTSRALLHLVDCPLMIVRAPE
ncbi:nucleotide-binding universal stress UspA family protein [Rhodococcus sp. PvR044]|jgi:nucleotide-binding universal stress UspA family protein|uniref:universal stress protein n=1 Tax=unclassified Rhodococcus (in: high G+C Gram-positive bacteria) TaxID=192944 RepID=UPI000BC614EE|nr:MULTISPECIES: universal stress protein [unclassified Rhodococcus (in: high G+C Gram-positive bacteria)]MBP1158862.1 nucleotide-binding universal stress UspA family protein [Rhodococcus sp. PvR099]PTR45284.1 nucleotide-binding universal stress UspA family protein [Rhodococcus sp. OK611]SNX88834.1 Nucleotide-binding universal stress protein, UspA family [Rhodococcus sp. OK270]